MCLLSVCMFAALMSLCCLLSSLEGNSCRHINKDWISSATTNAGLVSDGKQATEPTLPVQQECCLGSQTLRSGDSSVSERAPPFVLTLSELGSKKYIAPVQPAEDARYLRTWFFASAWGAWSPVSVSDVTRLKYLSLGLRLQHHPFSLLKGVILACKNKGWVPDHPRQPTMHTLASLHALPVHDVLSNAAAHHVLTPPRFSSALPGLSVPLKGKPDDELLLGSGFDSTQHIQSLLLQVTLETADTIEP